MSEAFRIAVSEAELADLHRRLDDTRFLRESARRPTSALPGAYLRELAAAWRVFDWRAREAWLNSHPQSLIEVGGVTLHVVHRRAARDDAPALLVMHGWPHTFALQLALAEQLPDFHVVLPSLPGFAYSPGLDETFDEARMADLMHALMTDALGYESYLTYGEDVSANISDALASRHPDAVAGIVVTHAHFPTAAERAQLTGAEERAFFARIAGEGDPNGAYAHVQATRPDTIAAALNDSPVGLLAWIVEKLMEWSDTPSGDSAAFESRLSRERVLTEAMIYWTTQSIATSFRPYFDEQPATIAPVRVPAVVAIQRHEHDYPRALAERFYLDLRAFERLPEGGHFAAAEVPAAIADRARALARMIGALP